MKVILVRHAKVTLDEKKKLKAHELKEWVKKYDVAAIDPQSLPTPRCKELLEEASFLVASKRSRTRDSLEQIGLEPNVENEIFNELEVMSSIPFFRMSAKNHLIASRILMLFPFGKYHSFLLEEKNRAKEASDYLESLAKEHEYVGVMGHGAMNFLLAMLLKKRGWKLVEKGEGSRNWSYGVYELF